MPSGIPDHSTSEAGETSSFAQVLRAEPKENESRMVRLGIP